MQSISKIRNGLMNIPGCLRTFPPEETFEGNEPGVKSIEISSGSGNEDKTSFGAAPTFSDDLLTPDAFEDFDPYFEIGAEVDPASPLFDGELGKRLTQSVLLKGVDAYGWYTSFHQIGVQWGVYISLTYMRYFIHDTLKTIQAPILVKAQIAFKCILNHELFHFATDYAVAQSELFSAEAWWWPMKLAKTSQYNIHEEKLANAYMLQSSQRMKAGLKIKGKQEIIKNFTKLQPEGYRDAITVKRHDWARVSVVK